MFCSYLQTGLKKQDDLTPKAFKAYFKVLCTLNDNLKADYELQLGTRKRTSFSSMPSLLTIKASLFSNKKHYKMMMGDLVECFHICYSTDQPIYKQCKQDTIEKREQKEANQKKDAVDKKQSPAQFKIISSTNFDPQYKWPHKENLCCFCKTDGYDVVWQSCVHHNWDHLDSCKPAGSSNNHSQDWAHWEHKIAGNVQGYFCSCSRSQSCDLHDHRDYNG